MVPNLQQELSLKVKVHKKMGWTYTAVNETQERENISLQNHNIQYTVVIPLQLHAVVSNCTNYQLPTTNYVVFWEAVPI